MNPALSDLLNYAHFIDEGIILNKDGAFLQTFQCHGPDIQSSTQEELNSLTLQFNRMLTFLEDGWMIHFDVLRTPSCFYPNSVDFPHPVAALIDEERRRLFNTMGEYYENRQLLSFVWKFPAAIIKKTKLRFTDQPDATDPSLNSLLREFKETVERCVGVVNSELLLTPLSSNEQLAFLNTCISGEILKLSSPPNECFLDVVLGRKVLAGGFKPRIEEKNILVLSLSAYLNNTTAAGLLQELCTYPIVYRWSNRFICLGADTAAREMKKYQKNWNNKVKGFSGILKEALSGKSSTAVNTDAADMSQEINSALTINNNHSVRFGYWTSVVVLMHEQIALLENAKKFLRQYLEQNGFNCHIEEVNAFEAFLGSIPGHGACNARRLFISSLNLAHVLPLYSIWPGSFKNENTIFNASTIGKTPFSFPLDIDGLGHQLIMGPTGSGKSTYLDFLIMQFLRFKNSQIFIFDKDFSHQTITKVLDGYVYNLSDSETLSFCPFSDLNDHEDLIRATHFLENLIRLQNLELTPSRRNAIHQALTLSASSPHRSLSIVRALIQNNEVREALSYYTHNGPAPFLDGAQNYLQTGFLQTFEMNWLLRQRPEVYLPVLFHIFDHVEKRLNPIEGYFRPTLIILEEAWLYISHPLFAAKITEWLKTLRKKNARVIFATQSLADLYDPATKNLTSITAQILEACPLRLFLANNKMDDEIQSLYEKIGCNSKQIEIISRYAVSQKDYYLMTSQGCRLFDLELQYTPLAQAFIGLSPQEGIELFNCQKEHGSSWIYDWLKKRNLTEWADYWQKNLARKNDETNSI